MNIEEEITTWLETHIPDKRKHKYRNIEAVLLHYGFGEMAWPTLEEIGQKMNIGTRERVRQVIASRFRKKARLGDFPVLLNVFEEISRSEFSSIPEMRTVLSKKNLISGNTKLRGVFNLFKDLGGRLDYELYDYDLKILKRREAEFDEKTFIIKKDIVSCLKKNLKKAKTLPGQLGLARFSFIRKEIGDNEQADRVIRFIELSSAAERIKSGSEEWYIFEDRDNTLINSCEKIFSITHKVNLEALAEALTNSLRRRSTRYAYPAKHIVKEWLARSKWFELNGEHISFLGDESELTEVEEATQSFLNGKKGVHYPEITSHLKRLGYSTPSIQKATTVSPLVYVDKSKGWREYEYYSISEISESRVAEGDENDRYTEFHNKLKRVLARGGTDSRAEVNIRREQKILREWLFADLEISNCAICGHSYPISALVAAHKKKRYLCSESERVDPHIVIPVCLFGCDYLYEKRIIKVEHGKVKLIADSEYKTKDMCVAEKLDGNILSNQWLKGEDYFFEADRMDKLEKQSEGQ